MQENTWLLTLGQNNKDTENGGPAIMSKEENEICFDFWKSAVLIIIFSFFHSFIKYLTRELWVLTFFIFCRMRYS